MRKEVKDALEDTGTDHVDVLALSGVVAPVELVAVLAQDGADDDGALLTGVLDDGPDGLAECGADDGDAELLVKVGEWDVLEDLRRLEERRSTTGNDTLLDGGAGRVKGVAGRVNG